jgi:hypothetical protein
MAKWVETVFSLNKGYDPIQLDTVIESKTTLGIYNNIKDPSKIQEKFKEGLSYYKYLQESNGKICMTAETGYIVKSCIESLKKHEIANKYLFEKNEFADIEYFNELEIYWKEHVNVGTEKDPIWTMVDCKSMLDRVIIDHDNRTIKIPDIKSTSKPKSQFQESFEYYRYYRQHAFQRRALKVWLESRTDRKVNIILFDKVDSYNVVVETIEPYQVGVVPLSHFWLKEGKKEFAALLQRVAWHQYYNIWDKSMEEHLDGGFLKLKDSKIWLRN